MVLCGILLGLAGGLLQLFLLRRGTRPGRTAGRRLLFFLVRYLLWAVLFAVGMLISLQTFLSLAVTALLALAAAQAAIWIHARKEDRSQ